MPSLRDPACLLPLILAGAASAQSQRISGELAHDPALLGGDVEEVFFSPDGSRLLFLADQESAGAIHLYSAPADGSASPVRLSPSSLGSELSSIDHEFSPDGSRVVFWRYGARYVAPIDGSVPAVDVVQGMEFVWMHELTPDGAQTLWIEGDQGPVNLYVGPTDASAPPALLLAGLGYTGALDLSPDGARVLLREEDCYPCVNYYISLPIDGSQAPVTLNPALPSVGPVVFSPDSSRLVLAGMTSATEMAMFAVPLDGSVAPTALTGAMPAGEIHLRLSPNGNRLVYALDAEVDDLGEVYSVPINGSAAPVKLSGALVPGGSVRAVDAGAPFEIAPDGLRVVYRADQQVLGQFELFKVPIVGGSATKLSGALVSGGDVHEFLRSL